MSFNLSKSDRSKEIKAEDEKIVRELANVKSLVLSLNTEFQAKIDSLEEIVVVTSLNTTEILSNLIARINALVTVVEEEE